MFVTIIDGGFSTQLAKHVSDPIDGDPLWSARFLATDPHAVYQTHLDFLNAGAEVIITNSYQASIDGFAQHLHLDRAASLKLIKDSVRLAQEARSSFMSKIANGFCDRKPLIAGSVGSYGASLHDGSEYTGSFISEITREQLRDWHRPRVQALLEAGVDLLALETIPTLEEALALLDLLEEFPEAKAWLSFQCRDAEHTAAGEIFSEAVRKCWLRNTGQLLALGCNCLDPHITVSLLRSVRTAGLTTVPFVVYPNSGETYNPKTGWSGRETRADLKELVGEWLNLGAKYVGGCCRTDESDSDNDFSGTGTIRKASRTILKAFKNPLAVSATSRVISADSDLRNFSHLTNQQNMSILVLEGSQCLQLEQYVGPMDDHPLWICKYLVENPELVKTMHKDYLEVGSDVLISLTYQVSIEKLVQIYGMTSDEAYQVIQSAVRLARDSWTEFEKKNGVKGQGIVGGSVGPYGALQHDGSEYTGSYVDKISQEILTDWHRPRVNALVNAGVDFLCFETIPSLVEARALLVLLREFPNTKAWVSFTCKEGNVTARDEPFGKSVADCYQLGRDQLLAIGCNCTQPKLIKNLLQSARQYVSEVPFVVYPNSGENFDPAKGWFGQRTDFGALAPSWLNLGAKYVGGCCRTDVTDIKKIREVVNAGKF